MNEDNKGGVGLEELNKTLDQAGGKMVEAEPEPKANNYPVNGLELYDKVLLSTDHGDKYPELRSSISTGYMGNDELAAIRRLQSVLVNTTHIIQVIKENLKDEVKERLNEDEWNIDRLENTLLRRIFFFCNSSKSKNGFTVLELNSQHSYHHENVYSKEEFKQNQDNGFGITDKLTKGFDKATKGRNKPIFSQDQRNKFEW